MNPSNACCQTIAAALLAAVLTVRAQMPAGPPGGPLAPHGDDARPTFTSPLPPEDVQDLRESGRLDRADTLRDPFWPVAWQPAAFGTANPNLDRDQGGIRKWHDAIRRVNISGLIRAADGSYLANVPGVGVVEVGDLIWVEYEDMVYKWRVRAITEKGIVPERLSVSPARNSTASAGGER